MSSNESFLGRVAPSVKALAATAPQGPRPLPKDAPRVEHMKRAALWYADPIEGSLRCGDEWGRVLVIATPCSRDLAECQQIGAMLAERCSSPATDVPRLIAACKPFLDAADQRADWRCRNPGWNPDAHIEITMRHSELAALLAALPPEVRP